MSVWQDDNADLLNEYNQDAPPAGSESEAEEDNTGGEFHEEALAQESPMNAVSAASVVSSSSSRFNRPGLAVGGHLSSMFGSAALLFWWLCPN